jgi:hypothetical protein
LEGMGGLRASATSHLFPWSSMMTNDWLEVRSARSRYISIVRGGGRPSSILWALQSDVLWERSSESYKIMLNWHESQMRTVREEGGGRTHLFCLGWPDTVYSLGKVSLEDTTIRAPFMKNCFWSISIISPTGGWKAPELSG